MFHNGPNLGELLLRNGNKLFRGVTKDLTGTHFRLAGALNRGIHTRIPSAMLSQISQFFGK